MKGGHLSKLFNHLMRLFMPLGLLFGIISWLPLFGYSFKLTLFYARFKLTGVPICLHTLAGGDLPWLSYFYGSPSFSRVNLVFGEL